MQIITRLRKLHDILRDIRLFHLQREIKHAFLIKHALQGKHIFGILGLYAFFCETCFVEKRRQGLQRAVSVLLHDREYAKQRVDLSVAIGLQEAGNKNCRRIRSGHGVAQRGCWPPLVRCWRLRKVHGRCKTCNDAQQAVSVDRCQARRHNGVKLMYEHTDTCRYGNVS